MLKGYAKPAPADMPAVSAFMSNFLAGQPQMISARGDALFTHNDSLWMTRAFKSLLSTMPFPGYDIAHHPLIGSVKVSSMTLKYAADPSSPSPSAPRVPFVSASITSMYNPPYAFPVAFKSATFDIQLFFENRLFASFSTPSNTPLDFDPATNEVKFSLADRLLSVSDHGVFQAFLTANLMQAQVESLMVARGSVLATTGMGDVLIDQLAFNSTLVLPGMNGFAAPNNPQIKSALLVKAVNRTCVGIASEMTLHNPTFLGMSLGAMAFVASFRGLPLMLAAVDDFVVMPGDNAFSSHGLFCIADGAHDTARAFLSAYTTNAVTQWTLAADPSSTDIADLRPALARLAVGIDMPGIGAVLFPQAQMVLTFGDMVKIAVGAKKTIPTRGPCRAGRLRARLRVRA